MSCDQEKRKLNDSGRINSLNNPHGTSVAFKPRVSLLVRSEP